MKCGVLVGGPLVEDADRSVFEQGREQGQPRASGPDERSIVEKTRPLNETRLPARGDPGPPGPVVESRRPSPREVLEQVAVGEDDREELAISFSVLVRDGAAVDPERPDARPVEARRGA